MDLYQGSLPRKFIPFNLGTSSNDTGTPNPLSQTPTQGNVSATGVSEFQFCSRRSDYDSDTTSGEDVTEYASQMVEKIVTEKSPEKITPTPPSGHAVNTEAPAINETIQGTAIPAIPHNVIITASGPNKNGLELVFPTSLAPQDVENFRQQAIAEGAGSGDLLEVIDHAAPGKPKISETDLVLHPSKNSATTEDESSVIDAPPLPKEPDLVFLESDALAPGSNVDTGDSGAESSGNEEDPKPGSSKSFKRVRLDDSASDTDYEMKPKRDPTAPRELGGRSRGLLKKYFSTNFSACRASNSCL